MAIDGWYPPVLALLAWGAAVFAPILLIRLGADYFADRRRVPEKPKEGGMLAVVEDTERLSPVVVKPSVPTPPTPASGKIFKFLRIGTLATGVFGILAVLITPSSRLAGFGLIIGFLGTLFVTAFEERYLNRFRVPRRGVAPD